VKRVPGLPLSFELDIHLPVSLLLEECFSLFCTLMITCILQIGSNIELNIWIFSHKQVFPIFIPSHLGGSNPGWNNIGIPLWLESKIYKISASVRLNTSQTMRISRRHRQPNTTLVLNPRAFASILPTPSLIGAATQTESSMVDCCVFWLFLATTFESQISYCFFFVLLAASKQTSPCATTS
jgi:hypothetical protein